LFCYFVAKPRRSLGYGYVLRLIAGQNNCT